MKNKKRAIYKNGGNAAARREPMQYGGVGMSKKKMMNGGRTTYKNGGEVMPKAKPC